MKIFYFIIAAFMMGFAWLSPFHDQPWVAFSSEILSFGTGLALLGLFLNQQLKIPKIQLWVFPVVFIPLLQWAFGLVFDFSVALISTLYLLGFWLMIVLGFNLSLQIQSRERLMQNISYLLFGVALLSSLMAIIQWLNIEVKGVMQLVGSRPYANFGQPNNMATFLTMGILGGLYLYEKYKISLYILIPSNLFILFAIALSQSRTSWVVCIFICAYWGYKQYKNSPRLKFSTLFAWSLGFFAITASGVKILTYLIDNFTQLELIKVRSVVDRASSGYERFDFWTQMLFALREQGWFGYGWNQTSIAQMSVFHLHPTHAWVASAHNVLLDLLVWNGIPLGLLIIGYMVIWFFWLNKNAKDIASIVAILMVSTILIHALLEFPYRYAYFLLPMGFLLGLIQAQTPTLQGILIDKIIIRIYGLVFLVLIGLIWRDYKLCHAQIKSLATQQQTDVKIWGSSRVVFLTQFKDLIQWARFNPLTMMSDDQLKMVENIVKKNPTMYNLGKYSMLLVYNNKYSEAEHQLYILNYLYKQNIHLSELIELNRKAQLAHVN